VPRKPLASVLIVEDYEPFSDLLRVLLQEEPTLQIAGFASDGLAGLHAAEDLQPDLILLDVGLPKMNGIETARWLRDLAPNSKIIFVTAERSQEIFDRAFEIGARGYVMKMDAVSELLPAIEAVLGGEEFVSSGCRTSNESPTSITATPHIAFSGY
jgi:DNA-binding NarL/FixJ family response regulator